jgi:hypothetical protein
LHLNGRETKNTGRVWFQPTIESLTWSIYDSTEIIPNPPMVLLAVFERAVKTIKTIACPINPAAPISTQAVI